MTIPTEIAATVSLPVVALVTALTITPSDMTAMLIAITALVTAIGIAIVNIMAARAVSRKVDENTKVTEAISAKADVIEGHVNSAATAAEKKNEALQQELRLMREVMADRKEIAALLAQSTATAPIVVPAPALVVPPAAAVLDKIEEHTEATAQNTKRTDAKIDALKDEP